MFSENGGAGPANLSNCCPPEHLSNRQGDQVQKQLPKGALETPLSLTIVVHIDELNWIENKIQA